MRHLIPILFFTAALLDGAVTVSNVRSSQRAGTNLVDIYYNVGGTTDAVNVSVELSDDGGASYGVPAASLSGDIGSGVQPGNNRHIVWNAGADWPGQFSEQIRFRVTANDAPPATGFAYIPGGTFQMGDSLDGLSNAPVHTVTVSSFYMQRAEVTKAEWDAVTSWAQSHGYDLTPAGGSGKGADHPVHTVTWYECVKFANAMSEMEGLSPCYRVGGNVYRTGNSTPDVNYSASGYRLPTEAEWEYAARGGQSGKRFPWGDTIDHDRANYRANSSAYSYDVSPYTSYTYHPDWDDGGNPYTSPAGTFAANGYGLYDMAGNLWEWCGDWYSSSYYGSSPSNNPTGPTSGAYRVFRGGSWGYNANSCRVAYRNGNGPVSSSNSIGFRLLRR